MHVGLVAPPWVPVPPTAYGGTEAVVDRLARGLAAAGHDVELFTIAESTCPVPRRWRYRTARRPMGDAVIEAAHVLAAYDALAHTDVVHDHTAIGPLIARRRRRRHPVVTTVHSPFTDDTRQIYRSVAGAVPLVCISDHQRADAPELPVAAVIRHGIDLEEFRPGPGDGGYLLFLGRMSRDKGVHRAIAVARAAGAPLLIAAKMRERIELDYYDAQVRPLLGGGIEYVGEVATRERLDLLQHARALLNPIHWHEPFGLVMIEALACGTPVITENIGSAPEIVEDGRTGFLCADDAELVAAVGRVDALDRAACRAAAAARFSLDRMVGEHERLYRTVIDARLAGRERLGSALGLRASGS